MDFSSSLSPISHFSTGIKTLWASNPGLLPAPWLLYSFIRGGEVSASPSLSHASTEPRHRWKLLLMSVSADLQFDARECQLTHSAQYVSVCVTCRLSSLTNLKEPAKACFHFSRRKGLRSSPSICFFFLLIGGEIFEVFDHHQNIWILTIIGPGSIPISPECKEKQEIR
jgi:hypothetical protein